MMSELNFLPRQSMQSVVTDRGNEMAVDRFPMPKYRQRRNRPRGIVDTTNYRLKLNKTGKSETLNKPAFVIWQNNVEVVAINFL